METFAPFFNGQGAKNGQIWLLLPAIVHKIRVIPDVISAFLRTHYMSFISAAFFRHYENVISLCISILLSSLCQ